MGRTKEFEHEKALDKAMLLFWEKGYENTSLKDLLTSMNILNGSFYNSFGNKKTLLLKTLEHYHLQVSLQRQQLLESHTSFKKGLRALFDHIFQCSAEAKYPRGCLLVNSLSKETLEDPEVRAFVLEQHHQFQFFFEEHIAAAIKNGELDEHTDPKMIASILVAYVQGCMKISTLKFDVTQFQKQTELLLSSIGI